MTEEESGAPSILVLGGLGTIGRNFVKYLVDFNLASYIRVVDAKVKSMMYFNDAFNKTFSSPCVEIVQGNLFNPEHLDRAFGPNERFGDSFSLCVNLAAETRYGKSPEQYELGITQLRILCAQRAAQMGIEKYIEVSTAQIYPGKNKDPAKETSEVKPWTDMAKAHLKAEAALTQISGLKYSIVRLPIVYGPADFTGLMPRLVCAATYQYGQQTMEFLWGPELRIHTVHVQDVAVALWILLCAGEQGEVYNCVDKNDTSQGKLNKVLEATFKGLKTDTYNIIQSNLAQLKLEQIVNDANDGQIEPWEEMKKKAGIKNTPLTPLLEKELLYDHHLAVDGRKLETLGFQCSCPFVTKELLIDALKYWIDMKLFPPCEFS